jgi:L-fuculose-phosphate aldolase
MRHLKLRNAVIEVALQLNTAGIAVGTSGNVSVRADPGYLITPTGIPYEALAPGDVVQMDMAGRVAPGQLQPSSEWRFHQDIFKTYPDVQAIVHTHSTYATALACTRRGIPAFHYMVARAGGASIPCAPYATFGTQALSDHVVETLRGCKACLLANHGVVATGGDPSGAFRLSWEVEELAKQYCISLQLGGPILLPDDEMKVVIEKFQTYGRQDGSDA